ncbi:DUF2796 domain-containing protein [Vibrio sp.]|uniref:zinc uptake protein ZrgA n=1 Tax=Vibrio sp. TaxID=678 RepID=UPI000E85B103|nr:DUF2796 domain-containing protein [Vibrio sp.]HBV76605.1 DUF2796 domain-containing protein [Vibrio sp.]
MFTNRFYSPFLLLGLSSICTSVFAEQAHQHEFIQHEAHVHGLVTFNIVQDGNELLVEINSPGNDVLGFEHQPKSDEDQKRYQQVTHLLKQPESILHLPENAQCKAEYVSVKDNIAQTKEAHHDHDHDHQHGTFTLEYHFQCNNIQQLSSISTQWFTQFPSTQTIDINLLTDANQQHIELKNPSNTIQW